MNRICLKDERVEFRVQFKFFYRDAPCSSRNIFIPLDFVSKFQPNEDESYHLSWKGTCVWREPLEPYIYFFFNGKTLKWGTPKNKYSGRLLLRQGERTNVATDVLKTSSLLKIGLERKRAPFFNTMFSQLVLFCVVLHPFLGDLGRFIPLRKYNDKPNWQMHSLTG